MSLINREQLLAHFAWWPDADENKGVFQAIIARQPDVDAVEVVRCRDCKYGSCTGKYGKYYECELSEGELAPLWREDDFCSYGERREDGADDAVMEANLDHTAKTASITQEEGADDV